VTKCDKFKKLSDSADALWQLVIPHFAIRQCGSRNGSVSIMTCRKSMWLSVNAVVICR